MDSIDWYLLQEINLLEQNSYVKIVGVVLHVHSDLKFFSFLVSDSTGTVQATLYLDQSQYIHLKLPQMGDSVIIQGQTYQKQIGAKRQILLKVRIQSFKGTMKIIEVISAEEEMKSMEDTIKRKRQRLRAELINLVPTIKKIPRKTVIDVTKVISKLQAKTIVLIVLYGILESNVDLTNIIFNPITIRSHRFAKPFKQQKNLTDQNLQRIVQEGIKQLLKENMCKDILSIKNRQPNKIISEKQSNNYIMQRIFFIKIQTRLKDYIGERKHKGISVQQLNKLYHQENGIINIQNYLFNQKLLYQILRKLIQQNKIYKNSQKLLFPNY